MLIGGMLTTFFFARLWRRANVLTELELIKIRYSGKKAAFLRGFRAVYIALIMNVLVIAWVNVALMTIIKVFFGVDGAILLWIIFAAMFIAAIYTTVSGLKGIAVTDAIQFFIAMFGAIILAVLVVSSDKIGGISGLKSSLPDTAFSFFPKIGGKGTVGVLSLSVGSFLAYGLVQWWASWYPGAEPGGGGYIAQRMMSTKNEKHSVYATLFFQIAHYAIRPWPWIIVGLASIVLYPNLADVDLRFGYVYTMRDFLPVGLKGLMLVGFLAAYMSTISTQLNFGASILTNDFFMLFIMKINDQKELVLWARIFTVFIMILAMFVTSQVETISGVWTFMIECGAGLGLVLILRWYWWRINAWSEFVAMILPFLLYFLSKFVFFLEYPNSFFLTVGGTTVAWLLVTFLTKPTDEKVLLEFYNRVRPQGWWKPYGNKHNSSGNVKYLLGSWFTSIVLVYSTLFLIGKIILVEWISAGIYFTTASLGLVGFLFFVKRAKIFED